MQKFYRLSPFLIAVAILTTYKIVDSWELAFLYSLIAFFLAWYVIFLSRKILLLDENRPSAWKLTQYHTPLLLKKKPKETKNDSPKTEEKKGEPENCGSVQPCGSYRA